MALPARLRSIPLGERALRFDLGGSAALLSRIARALATSDPTLDAASGSSTIVVVAAAPMDPLRRAAITSAVASAVTAASGASCGAAARHVIDVVYDGPDLDETARALAISASDVGSLHAEPDYFVELGGFLPGFAYLGEVHPRLRRPRRPQPRPRVARGSVGVAGRQTGIYPSDAPGGWNLLGRALLAAPLFDPSADPPARFAIGDRVRFAPVPLADAPPAPPMEDASDAPALGEVGLVVDRVAAVVSVQDGGRARWLHMGVPASGALDPVALAAANLAVGNDASAAGLEVAMGSARFVARCALCVSIDGATPRRLAPGDVIESPSTARLASYLAIRGGVSVPLVLGTRSTSLAASLGGFRGRGLRRGDSLSIGADPGTPLPERQLLVVPSVSAETVLRVDVVPPSGPLDATSVEALLAGTFTVSTRLDRVGVRLEGAPIPRAVEPEARPEPVVPGAVQIAGDGTPMVLGPDAAITGGYPVIGVLRKTSLWALHRLRPGARVRFARGALS